MDLSRSRTPGHASTHRQGSHDKSAVQWLQSQHPRYVVAQGYFGSVVVSHKIKSGMAVQHQRPVAA